MSQRESGAKLVMTTDHGVACCCLHGTTAADSPTPQSDLAQIAVAGFYPASSQVRVPFLTKPLMTRILALQLSE